MAFWTAFLIVTISCIAITFKTLAGYGGFSLLTRLSVLLFLTLAWFGPFIWRMFRRAGLVDGEVYVIGAKITYFLMGFVLILLILLIVREIVWYTVYYVTRNQNLSPDNFNLLNHLNGWTIMMALIVSFYAVWEANKTPAIRQYNLEDKRIAIPTKIVAASDLHIDQATPLWRIKQIVDAINAQNPDYVFLVGDIIDDVPVKIEDKISELQKIKAKKVFVSLGNHEYYNQPGAWMVKFTKMGFEVLQNTGQALDETGLYLGGIPDANSTSINIPNALFGSQPHQYKILISHEPIVADSLSKGEFDLQISGHTHGGQIFPFHFFAKQANHYLAGMYEVKGNQLYVTRGAGYWGPPMRLFAPSDITVFNFKGALTDE